MSAPDAIYEALDNTTRQQRGTLLLQIARLLEQAGYKYNPKRKPYSWSAALKKWRAEELEKGK